VRLPESLLEPKPDRIGSISPGNGAFLSISHVTVDKAKRVWVERKTNLIHSPYNRDLYLKLGAKGWVLTAQDSIKLRCDRKIYWFIANYDPVVEIIIGTNEEWKALIS
jgi:hypothetical protein